jgi:hypothetical protein
MLRLFLWLPIVFVLCVFVTFHVFMVGALVRPDTGHVLFTFIWEALNAFIEITVAGSPEAAAHMSVSAVLTILLTLFVLPVGLTIAICEIFRIRSFLTQMALTGGLTLFLPLAALEVRRPLESMEQHVSILLFLAGCAAGATYWLLAGRHAGGEKPSHDVVTDPTRVPE